MKGKRYIFLFILTIITALLLLTACNDETPTTDEGENSVTVPADHTHTYGEWMTVTPATCTTVGTRRRSCTLCGNSETEEIAALGHNFVGVTCTRCGLTLRETMGLSFVLKEDHTYTLTGYTGTDTDVVVLTTHSGIAVTSISNDAFKGNATIKSVIIAGSSNAALTIGKGVFADCTALTSVSLPANVISMGNIFSGCTALENIFVDENNSEYTSVNGVLFTKDKTKLLKYPESKMDTTFVFPEETTTIEDNAYYDSPLTKVSITTSQCVFVKSSSKIEEVIITKGNTIPRNALSSRSHITSVTIPDSVTSIGERAFFDCSSLTSVYYAGDIASWCRIEFDYSAANPLYYAHNLYINNTLVTEITIPDTVTEIKYFAFYGWNGTSITIPDSVTSIGSSAFEDCYKLVEVYNKSSLNITKNSSAYGYVGYYAKAIYTEPYVSKLSTDENGYILYTDGDNISLIGYTGANTVLTLPSGITEINQYAFYDNNTITSITIPDSVTSMGYDAFYNCSSLASVYYTGDIASWCGISFGDYDANPLQYAHNLYINNTLVTEITIPDTVTEIKAYAFMGWNGTSITISDSVTSIGGQAFYNCSSLTSVTIGNSVTSIGGYAFSSCYKLAEVYNKSSLNITKGSSDYGYVGYYAKAIYTQPYVSKLSTDENGYILYTDGDNISLIGYTGANTVLTLPSGITEINQYAFYDNNTITSITIPDSVSSIGDYAFSGCNNLQYNEYDNGYFLGNEIHPYIVLVKIKSKNITSFNIAETTKIIDDYAFEYCSWLTSITIPDSVTSIGESAFYYCSSLTSVTIGSGVTSIGDSAFSNCSRLTSVYYTGDIASWCGISFDSNDANPLYYAHNLYINNTLVEAITIPDTVTEIKKYAFYGWNGMSITIPDSVTSIGKYAFRNCSSLTIVTIGGGVTSIGSGAFYKCSRLTSIYYTGDIASWCGISFGGSGANPLEYAHNLYINNTLVTEITIPDTVTEIKAYTFYNWTWATSVTIPDSVTSIEYFAFEDCSSLTSVTIGSGVTSIGGYVFYNCSSLTSVYYTGDIASWCGISFGNYYANPIKYAHNLYINNTLVTEITIPDTVTEIKAYAFDGWNGMSVTIPDSVTSIGVDAFGCCYKLVEVYNKSSLNITKGSEEYGGVGYFAKAIYTEPYETKLSIDGNGYILYTDGDNISLIGYTGANTVLTLPSGITEINQYAFYDNNTITSITIPDSVTSIGSSAFSDCGGLTSVYYTGDVASWCGISFGSSSANPLSYAHNLYINNTLVTEITIPDTVTEIKAYAFKGWNGTSITISDSVTSIGGQAFYNCSSLTSVTIGNSVTSIGESAFSGCPIETARIPAIACSYIEKSNLKTVIITSGTSIGNYAFRGCSSLTSITIPDSVTSIGYDAFSGCGGLTSITIPDSVTSIGYDAFSNCSSLTSVTIPDSVTSIGEQAFRNCSSLTIVTIGGGVTSIGSGAFYKCSSLTSITIPGGVMSIGSSAFANCFNLTSVYYTGDIASWCGISFGDYDANPLQYAHNLYINNTLVTEITIPDTVTEIKAYAFMGWNGMSITIPDSVTRIGSSAFEYCSNLTSITIPDSVTSIEVAAFSGCGGLTSVTIGSGVTSIGNYAFFGCSSLTSITIPDSVTSIGEYAFRYCSSLTSVTIGNSVTSIGSYAFHNCTSLTSITIPDSVTSIGDGAFYNCSSLTSITFEGTKAQWNAISKGNYWNYNTGKYTIHCTDGNISR